MVSPLTGMSSALSASTPGKFPARPEGTRSWINAVKAKLCRFERCSVRNLELPIALGRGDIGLADEDAPLVPVLEIDGEVRHLPGGLRAVLTEHHDRILDAETGQIGGVAAARALEHLGDGSRHVELRPAAGGGRSALGDDRLGSRRSRLGRVAASSAGSEPRISVSASAAAGRWKLSERP